MVSTIIFTELAMEMKYTIIIFGVTINGMDQIIGNNDIMVISWSITSTTIKNKHNGIAYNKFI